MTYIPKSAESRSIVRQGLVTLAEIVEKARNERDPAWISTVYAHLAHVTDQGGEADAKDHWNAVKVEKCPSCLGNGFVITYAGGGEWDDECEWCERTGFVPVSFEP